MFAFFHISFQPQSREVDILTQIMMIIRYAGKMSAYYAANAGSPHEDDARDLIPNFICRYFILYVHKTSMLFIILFLRFFVVVVFILSLFCVDG